MTSGNVLTATDSGNPLGMKMVPLGVGDAFSERYYSSGLWCEYQGCSFIIDCAHPIRKIMREASLSSGCDIRLDTLNGIVMTHLHSDHASGLEGAGFYSFYVAKKTISLLAHKDVMHDIWPWHLKGTMAPECDPPETQRTFQDFFTPVLMSDVTPRQFGPFLLECRRTLHHIPTYAIRISVEGVMMLAYSSDTSFDPQLIQWLSGARLIIHETNVASHTRYESLAALPESLRQRMRLIHYPDDFPLETSTISPLKQGDCYIL